MRPEGMNVRILTDLPEQSAQLSGLGLRKVQWEVVSIAFMHHFHTKTSTVKDVSPGVNYMTFRSLNGLVEVKTIQVECHGANTKSSKPDPYHRKSSKEEVKRTTIIERSILEDQTSEVSMGSDNVICLFFLPKLVSITLRDLFGSLPNEGRRDERSVHS